MSKLATPHTSKTLKVVPTFVTIVPYRYIGI